MGCTARITMKVIMTGYKNGFCSVGSMVDGGGGTGVAMVEIVTVYPYIKGINFDLPHVIATAPEYSGVSHVGGDMFKAIPSADVAFMKREERHFHGAITLELHRNRATLTDEQLEVHTISAWKEGKSQQYGEVVRAAQLMFGRPLIWRRRDRINEKMRALQELIPNCNKVDKNPRVLTILTENTQSCLPLLTPSPPRFPLQYCSSTIVKDGDHNHLWALLDPKTCTWTVLS
ncbi:(R,S)-reticuline 7-O-methyltransferase [Camellia lanceoleosa]|uniref:(R,S)-reticuline 7-O-methyltransferase n=1 Tax=Camellia lanceoleosa TaxID=1840588 RepID=A0ACC0HID1_9ERIC|nr:(R,S)-reticuline 7-O-methyltransferase [Camellia lanceoleosa]